LLTRYLTSLLLVGISPNLQLGCSFDVKRSEVRYGHVTTGNFAGNVLKRQGYTQLFGQRHSDRWFAIEGRLVINCS